MSPVKAVIFDMDGVLIDSEHLWRKAMIAGFAAFGAQVSEDECRETMGRRFREVAEIWIGRRRIKATAGELEDRVTGLLLQMIDNEGKPIDGIPEMLSLCEKHRLKVGLATSSSEKLMSAVIKKLGYAQRIHAAVCADGLRFAKPHPEVFINCADRLAVEPEDCLVIEDSLNGVIAAKAARMQVIAVPDEGFRASQQFAIADYRADEMVAAADCLRQILEPERIETK
jgi:mannitol-1-/sugar-/sorbitol-6-/2-deoxyglucose-6-phosphatase